MPVTESGRFTTNTSWQTDNNKAPIQNCSPPQSHYFCKIPTGQKSQNFLREKINVGIIRIRQNENLNFFTDKDLTLEPISPVVFLLAKPGSKNLLIFPKKLQRFAIRHKKGTVNCDAESQTDLHPHSTIFQIYF
jgi:hypothetical protein